MTPTYTHNFLEASGETLRTCTWLCYHACSDGPSSLLDGLCNEDRDMHLWLNSALAQHGQAAGHLHSYPSFATDHTPQSWATKHQWSNLKRGTALRSSMSLSVRDCHLLWAFRSTETRNAQPGIQKWRLYLISLYKKPCLLLFYTSSIQPHTSWYSYAY